MCAEGTVPCLLPEECQPELRAPKTYAMPPKAPQGHASFSTLPAGCASDSSKNLIPWLSRFCPSVKRQPVATNFHERPWDVIRFPGPSLVFSLSLISTLRWCDHIVECGVSSDDRPPRSDPCWCLVNTVNQYFGLGFLVLIVVTICIFCPGPGQDHSH